MRNKSWLIHYSFGKAKYQITQRYIPYEIVEIIMDKCIKDLKKGDTLEGRVAKNDIEYWYEQKRLLKGWYENDFKR